jgi:hypothetical protein
LKAQVFQYGDVYLEQKLQRLNRCPQLGIKINVSVLEREVTEPNLKKKR